MTDLQMFTLAIAVILPVSMLILGEAKETLRSEMQALRSDIQALRAAICDAKASK
jgi:hypothetical protein